MNVFRRIFPHLESNIVGMVHVKALPGSPGSSLSVSQIVDKAVEEALIYKTLGLDSIIIENMHDIPYVKKIGPEIVSTMTSIACAVRSVIPVSFPVGIQILAGGNEEALAVAHAARLQYIRAEGYVFGHVADEGYIDACAGDLLRFRRSIGASNVAVFCDVKKKHSSHFITADVSLLDTIKAAQFFSTDGVILTGKETGDEVSKEIFDQVRLSQLNTPIIIGSGVRKDNLSDLMSANALIVGSYFKQDGNWRKDLDPKRIEDFMEEVLQMRKKQGQ